MTAGRAGMLRSVFGIELSCCPRELSRANWKGFHLRQTVSSVRKREKNTPRQQVGTGFSVVVSDTFSTPR